MGTVERPHHGGQDWIAQIFPTVPTAFSHQVGLGGSHGWSLLIPLALFHANFVLDTGITLVRRIIRRERWYAAHREHFYQRLVRSGKSHAFVTLWEMGLQMVVLALMLLYPRAGDVERLGLMGLVVAIWLAFFCYCESQFRMKADR